MVKDRQSKYVMIKVARSPISVNRIHLTFDICIQKLSITVKNQRLNTP